MAKQLDIRTAVAARLISAGNDNVLQGRRNYAPDELPAFCVYMTPREAVSRSGNKQLITTDVVIEYYALVDRNVAADYQADVMIETIVAAIEGSAATLGDDLVIPPGLQWAGDQIEYPEDGAGVLSVQVRYTAPHIEQHFFTRI